MERKQFYSCKNSIESESVKVFVAQLWPTLCNPMDCRLPGPSVQGILQTRILYWIYGMSQIMVNF